MKYYIPLILTLFIFSNCSKSFKINKKEAKQNQQYFKDIESICNTNEAMLWGYNLYGSILFVDPETRTVYANEEGLNLKKFQNCYVGILPEEVLIANTATNWDNKKWTMIMLPLPEDSIVRNELIIHELFHQHEAKIGLDKLHTPDCNHLNESNNRIWMKIEVEALKEALGSNNKEIQIEHIRMAVAARKMRKLYTNEYFIRENNLDLKEGLPQLTGLLLGGRSFEESKKYMVEQINLFQKNENFMRSFPYIIVPTYGLLMSESSTDWVQTINNETDITTLIISFYNFKYREGFPEMMQLLKTRYSGDQFEIEEAKREENSIEIHEKYKKRFLESPFVFIKMTPTTNFSFDPNKMFSFEDKGTIYTEFTATDSWGKLKVNDGALINSSYSYIYISAPFEIKGENAKGKDWEMTLNEGYTISPYKDTDKFIVTKQ